MIVASSGEVPCFYASYIEVAVKEKLKWEYRTMTPSPSQLYYDDHRWFLDFGKTVILVFAYNGCWDGLLCSLTLTGTLFGDLTVVLTNGVSLWVSPCTHTKSCREDETFDCTSVLCSYCQIATFTPLLTCLCLCVSSSLFVSKTKHERRTEKDTAESAKVKTWQHFRTWQAHSAAAHWKRHNMPRQLRVNLWLKQQFRCDCKSCFSATNSNQISILFDMHAETMTWFLSLFRCFTALIQNQKTKGHCCTLHV